MLLTKVTKAVYDAMPEELKKHYSVADASKPDGEYLLQADEMTELRNAKAREVERRTTAEATIATITAERNTAVANLEALKIAQPDAAKAEAATLARIDAAVAEEKKKTADALALIDKSNKNLTKVYLETTLNNVVAGIVDETDSDTLKTLIRDRVRVDVTGDVPKVTFLDEKGEVTADDLNSFKKTVADSPKFAKLIIGSGASGGGATGTKEQTSGAGNGAKKFADMNSTERTHLYRTNPAEFDKQSKAFEAASKADAYSKPTLIR
jgi:hypothetical protein